MQSRMDKYGAANSSYRSRTQKNQDLYESVRNSNISNFDVKQFNKEEVEILYINVNPTEIMNYTQAIIEIKLNQKKYQNC